MNKNKWKDAFKGVSGAIVEATKQTRKAPKRKATEPEKDIQARAEDLCDALGIRWFRIPDKLLSFLAWGAPSWTRVFVARYLAGTPDLMLFRKCESGDNVVRFIEIKTEAGKVQPNQEKWHRGLDVRVCYGWQEVEKEIIDFAGK